jgi:hypothetical protein
MDQQCPAGRWSQKHLGKPSVDDAVTPGPTTHDALPAASPIWASAPHAGGDRRQHSLAGTTNKAQCLPVGRRFQPFGAVDVFRAVATARCKWATIERFSGQRDISQAGSTPIGVRSDKAFGSCSIHYICT